MKQPYYRPWFLGEMFERTQLTLTDPFMQNFKIAQFWRKGLAIAHGFFWHFRRDLKEPDFDETALLYHVFFGKFHYKYLIFLRMEQMSIDVTIPVHRVRVPCCPGVVG